VTLFVNAGVINLNYRQRTRFALRALRACRYRSSDGISIHSSTRFQFVYTSGAENSYILAHNLTWCERVKGLLNTCVYDMDYAAVLFLKNIDKFLYA
jgi:hypothetical protein